MHPLRTDLIARLTQLLALHAFVMPNTAVIALKRAVPPAATVAVTGLPTRSERTWDAVVMSSWKREHGSDHSGYRRDDAQQKHHEIAGGVIWTCHTPSIDDLLQ